MDGEEIDAKLQALFKKADLYRTVVVCGIPVRCLLGPNQEDGSDNRLRAAIKQLTEETNG